MTAPTADASLVVPTRNRPSLVVDAVRSVLAGTLVPAEILVIDQSDPAALAATRDRLTGLRELAAGARTGAAVRHVVDPGRGASRARNRGIALATRPWILLIDDDVRVATDWCERLMAALEREPAGTAVTGRVVAGHPEVSGAFTPTTEERTERAVVAKPDRQDLLSSGNAGIALATLRAIGGFDPRLGPGTPFPAAEDNDLGRRLLARGSRIVFEPGIVVEHRRWRPGSRRVQLRHRYGLGQGAFYAKHARTGDRDALGRTVADVRRLVPRIARRLGRRDVEAAVGDLAYLLGMVIGFGRWFVRPPAVAEAGPGDETGPGDAAGPA